MGSGVPLLNEYKQEFLWKRLPQTILGGPKLRLGYDAPAYVYLNQILIWIMPWILGGTFTLTLELSYSADVIQNYLLLYCSVYGACIVCFVLVMQIISSIQHAKQNDDIKFIKKQNLLAEEDEIEFDSCCGSDTFQFIIPPKTFKLNILVHSVLSGFMCGLSLWYLLPWTLNSLYYYNYVATGIIHILGWLTVCIAQYPLTTGSPPELAMYRTMDVWEISPITRPFYVLLLVFPVLHLFFRYYPEFLLATQILHGVFVCLPVLWILGVLPPVDCLFLWLLEQIHVFLFGGSPMASDARLLCMVILSTGVYIAVYYIPLSLVSVVIAACFGYILSTDLGGLGTQIWSYYQTQTKNRVSVVSQSKAVNSTSEVKGFLWSWKPTTFLYHFVMVVLVGVEAGLLNYNWRTLTTEYRDVFGYIIIGLCIVEKIFRESQSVYLFFGLLRNVLFPITVQRERIFHERKKQLFPLGLVRRLVVNWVAPFVMLAYLSLTVTQSDVLKISIIQGQQLYFSIWYIFGVVRAFRTIWQSTVNALLEMSALHLIYVTLGSTNTTLLTLSIPVLLLIIGLCRDRLFQITNKLFFFFSLLFSSWLDKKQRRKSTAFVIFVSFLFFPVVLVILFAASILSSPLLPLFTLPIFFIAFPRPSRFWPESVGASANVCGDSVYYKQFAPVFAKAIRKAFADGSLGKSKPGNHYMVRYQDRLAWFTILERGTAYCTVNIKGLELQETSCHTAEAARLDDIFEMAFERENSGACGFNSYPLHSLTPVDAVGVQTYSDARNVLTGIIDSPDSFPITMSYFVKSLIWVVLHHVNKRKITENKETQKQKERAMAHKEKEILEAERTQKISTRRKSKSEINHNNQKSDLNNHTNTRHTTITHAQVAKSSIKNDLTPVDISNKRTNSNNHIYKPVTNLAGSPDFKCQYSAHISLPVKWRELPIEYSQLSRHISQFPTEWYKYVLSTLDWSGISCPSEKVALEVAADDALTNCYSQLIMACYSGFDLQGRYNGPSSQYKTYIGDVPWNAMVDWLAEDKELYGLVIKAFRYGFKLMIDHMLMGDIDNNEELRECLEDYDDNWYIGLESEEEWKSGIIDNKKNLFSLGHNSIQGTYSSRILSLQEVMVHIGRLNEEVVKGQWANLSLELLYLTNDDEERYSIQAHPTILRNLTVQAADPPLGYPIFSSRPLSVPTL
ncbi:hypothetical protein LOTGIDRAFT_110843 [Lottia gigantea]|uniref:Pecanex-like protein n=1 Tax=Lottia gigantea TaxID=225164 RepID=V4B5H2_LOTGI|nr:hypothetical protein LOTGIDRAFT_110843 [Lottia gigantea]ESP02796.1 hypothetical protein LOTGIDRAFT_110843 [Lottia gigantea]